MKDQLLVLLHNRMVKEKQTTPQFIGEFNGIKDLPHASVLPSGRYPAIYFWVDKSQGGNISLSFNTPLWEDWCAEEARSAMLDIDKQMINDAIQTLQRVSASAFQKMLSKLTETES